MSHNPKRWLKALCAVAIVLTFLPAFLGGWAIVFYPIGWVFVMPGLLIANTQVARMNRIKSDQWAGVMKTKKLLRLGEKRNNK